MIKFVINFVWKFRKTISENERKYSTFDSNTKGETITHDSDIDNVFESTSSVLLVIRTEKYSQYTFQKILLRNMSIY